MTEVFCIYSSGIVKKTFIISISAIFVVIGLLSIVNLEVHKEFNNEFFLDTSHENSKVEIKYPQINDDNLEDINKLIKEFAEGIASENYGEDYVNLNLKVENYKIAYYDGNLLSIVFKADGYVSTAAYPNSFLTAININLEKASIISLSDIYFIDDNFSEVVNNNFQEQFLPKKLKEWGINKDHELYDKYKKDLAFVKPCNLQGALLDENQFYFSESELVICTEVVHAIGDHFEVDIEYSQLESFLKNGIRPFV